MTEAMGLPPVLRAFVAEKLIESLDTPAYYAEQQPWRQAFFVFPVYQRLMPSRPKTLGLAHTEASFSLIINV